MKMTLEYNMSDEFEREEARLALDAGKMKNAIDDYFNELRKIIKHNYENFSEIEVEMTEKLRDKFVEILKENDLMEIL